MVSNNQKTIKGEPQNVLRRATSLPYMAICRNQRDFYCTSRMAKDGRIANKLLLLFYLHHKKAQNRTQKNNQETQKSIDKKYKKVYNINIKKLRKKENAT